MTPARARCSRFRGLLQIIRFNWPMYFVGALGLAALIVLLLVAHLPRAVTAALVIVAIPAAWWLVCSLVVSHWVYDRSPLCRWDWIQRVAPSRVATLINIHAGFDDSSDALGRLFSNAQRRTLDIFDQNEMREPSIVRARVLSPSHVAAERADFKALNVDSGSADLVTLLLAAHEIRQPGSRLAFFNELRRIVTPDGRIILVEHLRNPANFVAFGPGFMHFHSRRTWIAAIARAGLKIQTEFSMTPFVRVFVMERNS